MAHGDWADETHDGDGRVGADRAPASTEWRGGRRADGLPEGMPMILGPGLPPGDQVASYVTCVAEQILRTAVAIDLIRDGAGVPDLHLDDAATVFTDRAEELWCDLHQDGIDLACLAVVGSGHDAATRTRALHDRYVAIADDAAERATGTDVMARATGLARRIVGRAVGNSLGRAGTGRDPAES